MTDRGTLLVVDDTRESLQLLSEILAADGYKVRPADSGELALASVGARRPDLILLDIRMPGMDGFEVCRRLKAREDCRDIPVVFISAATEVNERVEGLGLGAVDFISKPFQREELLARVAIHLELSLLRSRLEKRVAERTAELRVANEQLQGELAARKLAEAEWGRLAEEARAANRAKDEFLAVLSHELRNPLAPIRTAMEVLQRAPPGGEQAALARQIIARQSEHLGRLVDDLLDITRISRGKIELHRARVDLGDVVRSTCEDLRAAFMRAEVVLNLELPPGPLWAEADATRVSQVVGNLLQNAVKFTPAGGSVTVEAVPDGRCARISVRDTGVGMVPRDLERMFEPFAQAEQGLARTQGGLGLGLALARGLVELHGGSIRARSEGPGRGSEFVVTLPLAV